jgi:type II secretory pathway component GspD/PulD (secretin)
VTDILNELLAGQKLILIRRQVSFYIHSMDEKIDSSWVPRVELSELGNYGKTEIVQVIVPLKTLTAEETAPDVRKQLSPVGVVTTFKNNTLILLDNAANLRRILALIQKQEDEADNDSLTHVCKYKKATEVADHLKKLLTDTKGPAMAIAVDERMNSVLVTGPADKISLTKKIIEDFDKAKPEERPQPGPEPILKSYPVPAGTADAIVKTLLAEHPTLKLSPLPMANEIVVFATPEEHSQLLKRLGPVPPKEPAAARQLIFIPLARSDPKEVVDALVQRFPSASGGPIIEASVAGSTIVAQGTPDQIQAIRDAVQLLESLPGKN